MMDTLTIVATMASVLKKPSKADAHQILVELIRTESIPETEAAQLYAFFMPKVNPAKSNIAWVAGAAAQHDIGRPYLEYLYSDGTWLMATDGPRLHRIPTDLSAGYYDKSGTAISRDDKYPDVERLIPVRKERIPVTVEDLSVVVITERMHAYRLPSGTLLNKAYLDAALNGRPAFEYYQTDPQAPVFIPFESGAEALVMPIRS